MIVMESSFIYEFSQRFQRFSSYESQAFGWLRRYLNWSVQSCNIHRLTGDHMEAWEVFWCRQEAHIKDWGPRRPTLLHNATNEDKSTVQYVSNFIFNGTWYSNPGTGIKKQHLVHDALNQDLARSTHLCLRFLISKIKTIPCKFLLEEINYKISEDKKKRYFTVL